MNSSLLAKNIRLFYDKKMDELSLEKRFHYVSRLYFWSRMKKYHNQIQKLKDHYLKNEDEFVIFINDLKKVDKKAYIKNNKNSSPFWGDMRKQAKQKRFKISGITQIVSSIRQYKQFYNTDYSELFNEIYGISSYTEIVEWLLEDTSSIFSLSTSSMNFIYWMQPYFKKTLITPEKIYEIITTWIGKYKDTLPATVTGLVLYTITHAIIGESKFYEKSIENVAWYQKLLQLWELYLWKSYVKIKLDIKLEFDLCCRMCGYKSSLSPVIGSEAVESWVLHGNYLIDTFNKYTWRTSTTLDWSEHRNVLFIMKNMDSPIF